MSLISEGADKVTKAKTHLILKHPFIAVIALALRFRCADEENVTLPFPTMGTDGKNVWWCAAFVATLTIYETIGVIAHEVFHVVFLHMFRRGNRDPLVWNISADYAINPVVLDMGFQLPADRLFEEKYRNWSVEAIYDDQIKQKKELQKKYDLPGNPQGQPGQDNPSQGGQPQPGDDAGEASQGKPGKDGGQGKKPLWGTFMEPVKEDGSALASTEKTELVEEIKVRVMQAAEAAKSIGNLPAAFNGLIKAFGRPVIDWHDYIQNWVSGHTPDNYTWRKPARKMLALYDMVAPSVEFNGAGVGVLSIDCSGSVSNEELVKYVTEIVGMIEICKPSKLYIIQHDAIVHRMDVWEQGDEFKELKIDSRGGTRIAPVFKHVTEKIDEEINWMVCFTDMEINDFPLNAPDYPVLWAATGNGQGHKFGTYLPIKDALEMKP
jgi:predicted metal-dependent peptidase